MYLHSLPLKTYLLRTAHLSPPGNLDTAWGIHPTLMNLTEKEFAVTYKNRKLNLEAFIYIYLRLITYTCLLRTAHLALPGDLDNVWGIY